MTIFDLISELEDAKAAAGGAAVVAVAKEGGYPMTTLGVKTDWHEDGTATVWILVEES